MSQHGKEQLLLMIDSKKIPVSKVCVCTDQAHHTVDLINAQVDANLN